MFALSHNTQSTHVHIRRNKWIKQQEIINHWLKCNFRFLNKTLISHTATHSIYCVVIYFMRKLATFVFRLKFNHFTFVQKKAFLLVFCHLPKRNIRDSSKTSQTIAKKPKEVNKICVDSPSEPFIAFCYRFPSCCQRHKCFRCCLSRIHFQSNFPFHVTRLTSFLTTQSTAKNNANASHLIDK